MSKASLLSLCVNNCLLSKWSNLLGDLLQLGSTEQGTIYLFQGATGKEKDTGIRCAQSWRFFATLWTVAHQAPLSMGFSRQEYFHLRGKKQFFGSFLHFLIEGLCFFKLLGFYIWNFMNLMKIFHEIFLLLGYYSWVPCIACILTFYWIWGWTFSFLIVSFTEQKLCSLLQSHIFLLIFTFVALVFGVKLKKKNHY